MSSKITSVQTRRLVNTHAFKAAVSAALAMAYLTLSSTSASAQQLVDQCAGAGSSPSGAGAVGEFCDKNLTYLSNGIAYWGLIICVIGVFVSASLWALGSKGQNPGQELTGKKGFIVCFAGAFAIGAAVPVINWMNVQAKLANPTAVHYTDAPDTEGYGATYDRNTGKDLPTSSGKGQNSYGSDLNN